MSTVKISKDYLRGVPLADTTVQLDGTKVFWNGEFIGHVWKGTRTYSPPLHKGSRIVKYHKLVPEWHGHNDRTSMPRYRCDTRQDVIRHLLVDWISR